MVCDVTCPSSSSPPSRLSCLEKTCPQLPVIPQGEQDLDPCSPSRGRELPGAGSIQGWATERVAGHLPLFMYRNVKKKKKAELERKKGMALGTTDKERTPSRVVGWSRCCEGFRPGGLRARVPTPRKDERLVRGWGVRHDLGYVPGSRSGTLFLKREPIYNSTYRPEELARIRMSRALRGEVILEHPKLRPAWQAGV